MFLIFFSLWFFVTLPFCDDCEPWKHWEPEGRPARIPVGPDAETMIRHTFALAQFAVWLFLYYSPPTWRFFLTSLDFFFPSRFTRNVTVRRDTDFKKHEQGTNTKEKEKKISISLCTLVIVVARNFYTNLSRNTCHSTRSIGKSCLPRNLSIAYTRDEHSNRNSRTRYTQFLLRMRGCIVPIDGIRTKRTEYRFLG